MARSFGQQVPACVALVFGQSYTNVVLQRAKPATQAGGAAAEINRLTCPRHHPDASDWSNWSDWLSCAHVCEGSRRH